MRTSVTRIRHSETHSWSIRVTPTAGRSDTVLIKDATATGGAGQNCVVYRTAAATFATPADAGISGYFAPVGGSTALAGAGIPLANFGLCVIDPTTPSGLATLTALHAAGFSLHDPLLPGTNDNSGGAGKQLKGNEVPNTPPWTLAIGAQYQWKLDGGDTLSGIYFYWQDSMWGRVFEDGADRIKPFEQVNMQLTFNGRDNNFFMQAFVKNLTNWHPLRANTSQAPHQRCIPTRFWSTRGPLVSGSEQNGELEGKPWKRAPVSALFFLARLSRRGYANRYSFHFPNFAAGMSGGCDFDD